MKLRDSYHIYAGATIILWASSYIMTRIALTHFSPLSLGFLRYFLAAVFLSICIIATKTPLPKLKDVPFMFCSGLAGFGLYVLCFNMGSVTVASAISSVVMATSPVWTAILALIFFKEKLKAFQWIAVAIEFFGIVVLALYGSDVHLSTGVLWIVVAAILVSIYNVAQRQLLKTYTPFQATAFCMILGMLPLFIFSPSAFAEISGAEPRHIICLLLLGTMTSAVAYMFWAMAFKKASAISQVTNYMFLTPFLATFFGFIVGGEVPSVSSIVGGVIIMTGVFLFYKDNFLRKNVI